MSPASEPRPAATVLLLRDGPGGLHVFLVRRRHDAAAFSGAHVFPGGRLDVADREADGTWVDGLEYAAQQLADLPAVEAAAYFLGAIRELFEEAGVLLARDAAGMVSLRSSGRRERFRAYRRDLHAGRTTLRTILERERLKLALDALTPYAHWTTPAVEGRRFDTRFFAAPLPKSQTAAHDRTETTAGAWVRPGDALDRAAAGRIVLPPPTWTTLRELQPFETVGALLESVRRRRIRRREPLMVEEDGRRLLVMPGDPRHHEVPGEPVTAETRFVWDGGGWRAETR